ncbi:4077_t:CDS:2 [Entrophospora sp. SA101]|nr:4077_t:CDS:2 [Entrophospora sp. SA101]
MTAPILQALFLYAKKSEISATPLLTFVGKRDGKDISGGIKCVSYSSAIINIVV